MENPRPNIFGFTDYRAYLTAYYEWRKRLGGFSHRTFAEHAGLKSRSYLRLVLAGKRNLTPDSISKFLKGLDLKSSEADAFTALVHFNQAGDFESRRHYWEAFLKCQPKSERTQRVRDVYSYLTRMAYPILLSVLRQPHASHAPESLAALTGLSIAEVEEALRSLESLGAIVKLGEGGAGRVNSTPDSAGGFSSKEPTHYRVTSDSFVTSDGIPNVAIQAFHRNMLSSASEKLELPVGEREFQSVLVALSKEEFEYLKLRLRDIADEIDERFCGTRKQSERVYAFNLNLIPVTPDFIRREDNVAQPDKDAAQMRAVGFDEPSLVARQRSVEVMRIETRPEEKAEESVP